MQVETQGIVCGVLAHGEHGCIVRFLTAGEGLLAAYVRGGRGRQMRPVLIPGNVVAAQVRSRNETQLPQASLELAYSRAPILSEPLPAAAVEWATALTATALPERQPYPRIYQGLAGLLDAIDAAQSAKGWGVALLKFERLLVAELGYGGEGDESDDLFRALDLSGQRIFRDVVTSRFASLQDSRARLVDRLRRALV